MKVVDQIDDPEKKDEKPEQEKVNLEALAEEILRLMKQDLLVDNERIGRLPRF